MAGVPDISLLPPDPGDRAAAGVRPRQCTLQLGVYRPGLFTATLLSYLGLLIVAVPVSITQWPRLQLQVEVATLTDIIVLSLLAGASGGIGSELLLLIAITVAAGAILLPLRSLLTLIVAAILAVLIVDLWTHWAALTSQLRGDGLAASVGQGLTLPFQQVSRVSLVVTSIVFAGLVTYALAERTRRSERLAAQQGHALRELDQLNQAVIQQLQSGILAVAPDNSVRLTNEAAQSLLDRPAPPGSSLPTLAPVLGKRLQQWRDRGTADAEPFRPAPHLPEISVWFTALGGDRSRSDTLIMLEDYRTVEEHLQRLKLAALGRMSASIAHELRNPLTAIGHAVQLLQESGADDSTSRRLAEIIHANTRRANRIISDVLDLARREPARPESVPLLAWLHDWRGEFLMACSEQAPQIDLGVEPEGLTVRFDPNHLRQILDNLATNACRYGVVASETHARIRLQAWPDQARGQIILAVSDAGPGIAKTQRDKLFEPFHTTSSQGTGLGLYITRELCEANQARIQYVPGDRESGFRIRCLPGASSLTSAQEHASA